MNRSQIYNSGQYEGWLMGGPEFEIILASEVTTSGGFDEERQCAGEYASATSTDNPGVRHPDYDFNQDNDIWTGLVKLATLELLSSSQIVDNGTTFMVWEDDKTACRIRQSSEWVTWVGAVVSGVVSGGRSAIKNDPVGVVLSAVALITATFRMLPSLNSDDLVGWIVAEDVVGAAFPSGSHAIFDDQQQIVGNLNLVLKQP